MQRYSRILIALTILLGGVALLPHVGLFAGVVNWQRFAGGYEDVVTVTRARYRDRDGGELEVRALSSAGGAAVLDVFRTADGSYIGRLIFNGSEHRAEWEGIGPYPQAITVRSSLGGESTVIVLFDSGFPPTVTPSVSPTNVPGTTQTPTRTPVPGASSTPTSTNVPGATNTPASTNVPGATNTPTSTNVPGVTNTPVATTVPSVTSVPTGTAVPSATTVPTGTAVPSATSIPTGTTVPEATSTPMGTTVPSASSTPTGTTVPDTTSTPTSTIVPGATSTAIATPLPPREMQLFLPIVNR